LRWFQPQLARLEAGRFLRVVVWITGAALGLAAWSAPAGTLDVELSPAVQRGLTREHLWLALVMVIVPLAVLRAAGAITRWRAGEADWLALRGPSSSVSAAWTVLGTWSGGACLMLAGALVVETQVADDAPALATHARTNRTRVERIEPGERQRIPLRAPAATEELWVRARVAVTVGAGPTTRVQLRVLDESGGLLAEAPTAPVVARHWLQVRWPQERAAQLELVNRGDGAIALLADGALEWCTRATSERHASLALVVLTSFGLLVVLPLAFGLGAWISPMAAAGLALCLWWLATRATVSFDMFDALNVVAQGHVPRVPTWSEWSWTFASWLVAWGLVKSGTRSARHAP